MIENEWSRMWVSEFAPWSRVVRIEWSNNDWKERQQQQQQQQRNVRVSERPNCVAICCLWFNHHCLPANLARFILSISPYCPLHRDTFTLATPSIYKAFTPCYGCIAFCLISYLVFSETEFSNYNVMVFFISKWSFHFHSFKHSKEMEMVRQLFQFLFIS